MNYREHARETGTEFPVEPPVFTKFRTSITGPRGDLALPGDTVDREAELVVIGRQRCVPPRYTTTSTEQRSTPAPTASDGGKRQRPVTRRQ
ncbi:MULTISPECIES: fumarylacetoacetate hydrolase family protein [unclassified Streptomyces]|uniref:fumarylacetoacetate hydrolase family protein n=1 Tax=unclassified Streptomyces TaxID=2593676 RepID=UPI002E2F92DB|nr:fumarylacetoacetate hydrolase family protein [Streptomyces sp. NBC_01462]